MKKLGALILVLACINCSDQKEPRSELRRVGRGQNISGINNQGPSVNNPTQPPITFPNNQQMGGTPIAPNSAVWGLVAPQHNNLTYGSQSGMVHGHTIVRWFLAFDKLSLEDIGATTYSQDDSTYNLNCQQNQKCGIAICLGSYCDDTRNVPLEIGNGMPLPQAIQSGQGVQVQPNGLITLRIFDAYAEQTNPQTGQPYGSLDIYVPLAQNSYIQSNQVNLSFQDQIGSITMNGQIVGSQLQGYISYQNFTSHYDQSIGPSAVMGQFAINACAAFRCQ